MKRRFGLSVWFLMLMMALTGCMAGIEKSFYLAPAPAGLLAVAPPDELTDDLDLDSLNAAIDTSIRFYQRAGSRNGFCFHERCYQGQEMIAALQLFRKIMNGGGSGSEKAGRIREAFDFYQAAGRDGRGGVLFTGYYEPVLDGSLTRTERFRYPLYRPPEETVTVRLDLFNPKYGRDCLVGRLSGRDVIPHYSRKDIETDQALAARGLEIAWVDDPVALFILHIQGSGQIRLPNGQILRVNYAQSNGKPFRGLTAYMVERGFLSAEEKSYRHMKAYLQSHPEKRDEIMNHNESYVFFRVVEEGPIGSLGLPVIADRSIATDPGVFPRGALVFMRSRKPTFDSDGQIRSWLPYTRFVFSHDAGGAIKGAGRADLFCGTGKGAERLAGSLTEKGEMFFLAPRPR